MASRFPSIEEFEDGQTSPTMEQPTGSMKDEESLFALEQAVLGEDANKFKSDNNQLDMDLGDDDLLGGGGGSGGNAGDFASSFPDLDDGNSAVGPGGTITGSTAPYMPGAPSISTNYMSSAVEEEEPEVIKQWRERQALEIQRRDELSENRKQETIAEANKNIDDFYENYNVKKEKAIAQTRREEEEFLDSRENTSSGGTSWERIAKLVDLSDKGVRAGKSDKTRFRELLLSLRKDERAPGATVA